MSLESSCSHAKQASLKGAELPGRWDDAEPAFRCDVLGLHAKTKLLI